MEQITPGDTLNQVAQAGTYWVRSHSAVSWAAVEPVEGERNWNALAGLDEELRNITDKGMQTILSVRVTPSWAQQVAGYSCGPIKPEKLGAFASFVHDLVARYSVPPYNVKYWEIWNEPDIDYHLVEPTSAWGCWGDQSDDYYGGGYYAEMLKATYPQIKAADPQAQVLIGGLLLDCDPRPGAGCATVGNSNLPPKFLEGILRNNGAPYFDGVSFHSYDYYQGQRGQYDSPGWQSAWNTTGPVLVAKTQFIQSLLSQYGVSGKFLMNTEVAILCDSYSNDSTFETTKAYFVTQAYAAAIAQGLRANLWYSVLGWRNSGLLNSDLSPRPAYTAFQFARNELRDAAWVRHITEYTGVTGYEFQRSDRRIWVLWSLDGNTHSVNLSAAPLAAWDALGNSVPPAASMDIDLNPFYLEWNP
ncbi:MAG: cellulase family glycosylhydrolase [Nanoarchaeota archaeon]|nr:cellulase family glycosylhydrolase [Nanoarchaeota archaeon]